jgi:hypothetical protein
VDGDFVVDEGDLLQMIEEELPLGSHRRRGGSGTTAKVC